LKKMRPRGARGVAKSHDEVTFYRFHNTYYTTLLTYPREIKNSENTSAYDESGPNFSPKSAQMRRTRAARAARAVR